MKTKQVIFCSLAAVLTVSVSAAAILFARRARQNMVAADEYTITVGADEFANSELDENYQELVTQDLDGVDAPTLNYYLAKKDSSDNLILAPAGRVYNYSADAGYSGRITNLVSITVNYSGGTLFVQEGIGGDARQYEAKAQLTSGAMFTFATHPNHFMISNAAAETTITSISFKYTCEAAGYSVDRLGTTYNAMGSDGKVYTVTRDGNNVTVNVEENTFNGTIEVDSLGNFTVNLPSLLSGYTGRVSSDYRKLEVTGKTGAVPEIGEFNRVYVLNDFEHYADRGTGFTADRTSAFTVSNLRGDFYVDAGAGSGATWVSGSSFKIPSTSNYLNLATGIKHSGNKAMLLQGQKAGWVRAWTSDVWNSHQHFNYGKGDQLSFWVYSGRNNPDGTGVNASNVKLRAQVYYENFPKPLKDSNRDSTGKAYGSGTVDFTINSGSDWTECIIPLDPTRVVSTFYISINNSGIGTDYVFMPIDDITVSTKPVFERTKTYEETSTRFTKSYHGFVSGSVSGFSATFTLKVGLGADGSIYAYCAEDMEPTSYEITGNTIVINTAGSYNGKTFGTWTGTLSNDKKTITILKSDISGTITDYITSDTITLTENTVLADGSEAGLAALETKVLRQYYGGSSWSTDSTNADRLSINTNYYMEGGKSIRFRPHSSYNTRLIMNPSFAETIDDLDTVAFWIYAPAGTSYHIQVFSYKTEDATGSYKSSLDKTFADVGEADYTSGWHYFDLGLYKKDGYGKSFSIWIGANAKQTILDYVTYF